MISLLQAGASQVFITSRKAKACEEACAALNALPCSGKAISVPADLSKDGEVARLVKEVEKHTDHVDILLANAGATWGAPFDEHPENAFAKVMDLNVKSVFVCIQQYVLSFRHMMEGMLICIGSLRSSARRRRKTTPHVSSPQLRSQALELVRSAKTQRSATLPQKPPCCI